jgi:hypothetical protein
LQVLVFPLHVPEQQSELWLQLAPDGVQTAGMVVVVLAIVDVVVAVGCVLDVVVLWVFVVVVVVLLVALVVLVGGCVVVVLVVVLCPFRVDVDVEDVDVDVVVEASTSKSVALVAKPPSVLTWIGPVVTPSRTRAVICVDESTRKPRTKPLM